jgi:hypothetical protein
VDRLRRLLVIAVLVLGIVGTAEARLGWSRKQMHDTYGYPVEPKRPQASYASTTATYSKEINGVTWLVTATYDANEVVRKIAYRLKPGGAAVMDVTLAETILPLNAPKGTTWERQVVEEKTGERSTTKMEVTGGDNKETGKSTTTTVELKETVVYWRASTGEVAMLKQETLTIGKDLPVGGDAKAKAITKGL